MTEYYLDYEVRGKTVIQRRIEERLIEYLEDDQIHISLSGVKFDIRANRPKHIEMFFQKRTEDFLDLAKDEIFKN